MTICAKRGGGQKRKGWKEGGQRTKEGERELRQRKPRGEHKAMQPSDPSTLRHEGTIMLRE